MQKIKIIHVIIGLQSGGAEEMLYKILSKTNRDHFDVQVVSFMKPGIIGDKLNKLGIPITTFNLQKRMPIGLWPVRFYLFLRKAKPDIIQSWMYHANVFSILAALALRPSPAVIWNIRYVPLKLNQEKRFTAFLIYIGAYLSKLSDNIICNSFTSARRHNEIGYDSGKIKIIPNGFDLNKFYPDEENRKHLRSTVGVPNDTVLIGLIARYHTDKGPDIFLNAASHFKKVKGSNVRFIMVGRGMSVENIQLLDYINSTRLIINQDVYLLGERKNIPEILSGLDILALTSRTESFPNVIGEAMLSEVPCAVSDVGDSAEILGGFGVVISSFMPKDIAEGWHQIISLQKSEKEEMVAYARKRIEEKYALDTITKCYEDLYQQLFYKHS